MRARIEVLDGFWVGKLNVPDVKFLKIWSWRRDLNPRPSDYKFEGTVYKGVRLLEKPITCDQRTVENVNGVSSGGSLGGSPPLRKRHADLSPLLHDNDRSR